MAVPISSAENRGGWELRGTGHLLRPLASIPTLPQVRRGAGSTGSNPQGSTGHSGHRSASSDFPLWSPFLPRPPRFPPKVLVEISSSPGTGFFHQGASWAAAAEGRTGPARPLGTPRLRCPKVALGFESWVHADRGSGLGTSGKQEVRQRRPLIGPPGIPFR